MAENFDGLYDTITPRQPSKPFAVPSYKKYNSIEGIWQLEYTRDKLAQYGLKDPWMRNEIWRYPVWAQHDVAHTFLDCAFGRKFIGVRYGLAIATSIIICQNIYWRWRYGERPLHADNLLDWIIEERYARDHPNQ